jgi:nucleotide-binding universal stress UspA family protein
MFQQILVGLDGSESSRNALDTALELARLTGGRVHAVSVEEHLPMYAATVGEVDEEGEFKNKYFDGVRDEALRIASNAGVVLTHEVMRGHAADLLVRTAKSGHFDLVVLGHTGHSRLHHVVLGSTADRVVEHAPCPVLIARHK